MAKHTWRRGGLVGLLIVAFAACGDSGDPGSATTGAGSVVTAEGTTPTGSGENDCDQVFQAARGLITLRQGQSAQPEVAISLAREAFPSEFADEIDVMADAADVFGERLDELDLDPETVSRTSFTDLSAEQQQGVVDASRELDSDAVRDAYDAIRAFAESECPVEGR